MGLGPAAWFRNQQGITQSGGFVSQWNDQSGNGRHLIQGTGASQPALQADGSILFDGVDDFLKCAAFTLNQPATVYILGKQVTWTSNDSIAGGDTNGVRLRQENLGISPDLQIFAGSATGVNANLPLDTYGGIVAVYNGASSLLQINNTTPATGDAGANNLAGFTLGSDGSQTTFGNLQAKESIVYVGAHDAATRVAVISYLATVGGLSL